MDRLVIMLMLAYGLLAVSGNVSAMTGERLSFVVSPKLCVMNEGDAQCIVSLQVRWQRSSPARRPWCLFVDDRAQALHCDDGRASSEVLLEQWVLTRDTRFFLRRQGEAEILAQAEVAVARVMAELRPRRRHGWSIF